MSDGASDGYRMARDADERQKKTDAFFMLICMYARGERIEEEALRDGFMAFDAIRHSQSIARGRFAREKVARWEDFRLRMGRTSRRERTASAPPPIITWGWILSMAMQAASPKVVDALRKASPYARHRIGLYVPNGTSHDGHRREPSIYGDFAEALDAVAQGGSMDAAIILDEDRAIIGLRGQGPNAEEIRDSERSELRFIAVLAKEQGR